MKKILAMLAIVGMSGVAMAAGKSYVASWGYVVYPTQKQALSNCPSEYVAPVIDFSTFKVTGWECVPTDNFGGN